MFVSPMSELSILIRRVTNDLHNLQNTLGEAARPDAAGAYRERVLQELVDANMVDELKSAVDHMRHLLWSYIEVSSNPDSTVSEKLQRVRMQRVTEMLRGLQSGTGEPVHNPDVASFFGTIHQIANTAIERHGRSAEASK